MWASSLCTSSGPTTTCGPTRPGCFHTWRQTPPARKKWGKVSTRLTKKVPSEFSESDRATYSGGQAAKLRRHRLCFCLFFFIFIFLCLLPLESMADPRTRKVFQNSHRPQLLFLTTIVTDDLQTKSHKGFLYRLLIFFKAFACHSQSKSVTKLPNRK